MKKILLTLSVLMFSALCAFSQDDYKPITWTAKGGMNFSKVSGRGDDFRLGYQFGVGMEYSFTENWSFEPSLVFISKGSKQDFIPIDANGRPIPNSKNANYRENKLYIQVPFMLSYRLRMGRDRDQSFWLGAGPYVACGVGGKSSIKHTDASGKRVKDTGNTFGDGVHRFDAGIATNLSFEYKQYMFAVVAEWGITKVVSELGGRNQTFGCNVGYRF